MSLFTNILFRSLHNLVNRLASATELETKRMLPIAVRSQVA